MTRENTDISITFIIPVLNGQKYIAECLDHIIREKASSDEIIVVDNGSTDDTPSIVGRYQNVTLFHAPHITIGASRNYGAARAKGELFAFIDCDCILATGWRSAVCATLKDESIAATGSRYDLPEQAHWIEKAWYSKKHRTPGPVKYINSGNLIIRKSAFEGVSGFDTRLITDEDYDIGQRLIAAGYVVWENPQVSAIHLGNAKSLMHFYRKERWHAASSLDSTLRGKWDRPTLMTVLFIFFWALAIAMVPWIPSNPMIIIAIVIFVGLVPLVTAVFRVLQYRNFAFFFPLIILYMVFYVSRASIISKFVYKSFVSRAKPENRTSPS